MNKSKNITKTAKAIILVGLFAMVLVPAIAAAQDDVIKWRLQSFVPSGGSDWKRVLSRCGINSTSAQAVD